MKVYIMWIGHVTVNIRSDKVGIGADTEPCIPKYNNNATLVSDLHCIIIKDVLNAANIHPVHFPIVCSNVSAFCSPLINKMSELSE